MQYDDTRIQYDQSNVSYDGSFALVLVETASYSEVLSKSVQTTFSEVVMHSELLPRSISAVINETVTHVEAYYRLITISINEIVVHSETIGKAVGMTISEIVTHIESLPRSIFVSISETVSHIEEMNVQLFERLKNAIGAVKQYVQAKILKQSVAIAKLDIDSEIEILNSPSLMYNESSIQYDSPLHKYGNFIQSDKPVSKLSILKRKVSISEQQDKPKIAKL
jgi:uncharacterized protein YicC (UPF0701 family)